MNVSFPTHFAVGFGWLLTFAGVWFAESARERFSGNTEM
jgi:hypothetical protein